jgi:hypothetical protein
MPRFVSIGPQLSSVHSSLTELTKRLSQLADEEQAEHHEDVATALYEIERSLNTANRRLERLVNRLR